MADQEQFAQPAPQHMKQQRHYRQGADYCKGCRTCWNAVMNLLGRNGWVAGAVGLAPPAYAIMVLVLSQTQYAASVGVLSGPIGMIVGLIFIAGVLLLPAIKWTMPNVLWVAEQIYASLAHWCIISVAMSITIVQAVNYYVIQLIFTGIGPLYLVLLVAAGVLDAHRQQQLRELNGDPAAAAAAEAAVPVPVAQPGGRQYAPPPQRPFATV